MVALFTVTEADEVQILYSVPANSKGYMMVKVISTPCIQTTCYNCKSVLEYTFNDIREKTTTDYIGGRDAYRGFDCPVCKSFITVKT